jgi:hypothetical protein
MSNPLKGRNSRKLLLALLAVVAILLALSCITIFPPGTSSIPVDVPAASNYVILTNIINTQDPYYAGIVELQKLRNGRIVRFDQTARNALAELVTLRSHYIAVLVKPEVIDQFFAYDIFCLARETGNKTGLDVTYGFVTGDTAQNLLSYIQRLKSWESDGRTKKPVFRAYFSTSKGALGGIAGGWGDKQTSGELNIFTNLGINSQRIDVNQLDDAAIIADLQKFQLLYLHFLLHGSPTKLDGLPVSRIANLGYPSVIFNSGCYGGCIGKWYDESAPEATRKQAIKVTASQSLSMRFLNSGCMAYFGHMRMTGSNLWVTDMTDALANSPSATAGDIALAWYKKADQPQKVKTESGPIDQNSEQYLYNYSTIILIGDPAVRVIPGKGT